MARQYELRSTTCSVVELRIRVSVLRFRQGMEYKPICRRGVIDGK